jgi:RNA polymerase sigma factor (sigma-70 family)
MSRPARHARDRFATTRGSLVFAASGRARPRSEAALASLCETYWYPVYAYLRRAGHSVDEAQDLTQAFFTRLLEKNWLEAATPARGRFRSFLLASLKHFVANERDRARALKRGGAHPPVPLETAEHRYSLEPRDNSTPETIYNRQWALAVFDRVFARLQRELEKAGKSSMFDELKSYVSNEDETLRYRDMAVRLGMSEGAVKVTVHRLRGRFRTLLRDEVADSVITPEEIDDEVRYLKAALGILARTPLGTRR